MTDSLRNDSPASASPALAKSLNSILLLALALIYLVIRFGFTQTLDSLGGYASYIFELECVIIALILNRKTLRDWFTLEGGFTKTFPLSLLCGFAVFKLAQVLGIVVPFDLGSREIIFFLLIVAPILEELLFRFLLWQPIQILTQKPILALLGTSLLFSYSHLHAMWFVPAEFHQFILFQTAYTLFLAMACGFYVYRHRSVSGAMLIHFAFNLGFFLASLI